MPSENWGSPADLDGEKNAGRARKERRSERMFHVGVEISRIHVIGTDVRIVGAVEANFEVRHPLAHRPVQYVIADKIAGIRAAECRVLSRRQRKRSLRRVGPQPGGFSTSPPVPAFVR